MKSPQSYTKQTLSEEQFLFIDSLKQEYEEGMLALNSLQARHTLTFYGGHMVTKDDESYKCVHETAKMLGEYGWGVVTGGGPGIMEAGLSGAREGNGQAIAFKINIPGEPQTTETDVAITFSHFSARKYLLRQSDAFVFAPGGVGTLDEMMELITLMSTNKYPYKKVFLIDSAFWKGYLDWFETILLNDRHVIKDHILGIFNTVDTAEEIITSLFPEK